MPIHSRKPSSRDVALHAGVSQATVSYVFSGKHKGLVSEENRMRVLSAAEQIGYRPNSLARGLLKGKTNTIGVFVSYLGSRFHADIVRGAQRAAHDAGYSLLIAASETDHMADAERIDFLLNHQVEAIMIVGGFYHQNDAPKWLKDVVKEGVPTVVVDDSSSEHIVDTVVSDDRAGMREAVRHLYERGHRRISYLTAAWTSTTAQERLQGFLQGASDLGLAKDHAKIIDTNGQPDDVYLRVGKALALAEPPSAIVAAIDHFLPPVVKLMRHRKMTFEDLAIMGYGNQEISWSLDLSSACQQPENMGGIAAGILFERLKDPDLPIKSIRTPIKLYERESTTTEPLFFI